MHILVLIWTSLFMQTASLEVAAAGHIADCIAENHVSADSLFLPLNSSPDNFFKGLKSAGSCAKSPLQDDSTKNDPVSSNDDQSILLDDEDIPDFFTAHRFLPCIISTQHYLVAALTVHGPLFYTKKQISFSVSRKVERVFRI